MKRVLVIICLIVMILSLVACDYIFGTNNNNGATNNGTTNNTGTNNNIIDNILYTPKTTETIKARDVSIKLTSTPVVACDVTPAFDYDALLKHNCKGVKITLTYTVYYVKDSIFSGTPEYTVAITSDDLMGWEDADVKASLSKKTKKFERNAPLGSFMNNNWKLSFSTDTLIGTIYFTDISITYQCIF